MASRTGHTKRQNRVRSHSRISPHCKTNCKKISCATALVACEENGCSKMFKLKETMKRHMKTHQGEKPYVCNTCKDAFTNKRNFDSHQKTHNGEKPSYGCNIYDKSFSSTKGLKYHQKAHTGEKPYVCKICNTGFTSKAYKYG